MDELKTHVTILCNRTKTYFDYDIFLEKITKGEYKGNFLGKWSEITEIATPFRSGFRRMNPMTKAEGPSLLMFRGAGAAIGIWQQDIWISSDMRLANVGITLDVWQHAFPVRSSGEQIARKTVFGPVVEPGIALFWDGAIISHKT
jgi:hypothetical protein